MIWLAFVAVVVVLSFGLVVFFGAPYLPTLTPQVETALELIDLKPGQTLLELGCGDGKVLVAAAQTGLTVVGYELNPILALVAWARTRRFKKQVRVVWGNFFTTRWPAYDGIFVFLHTRFMQKLDTKIMQNLQKDVRLVSFAFEVPGRESTVHKKGIYRYDYSA